MGGGVGDDKTPELNFEALNLNRESNRIGCIRAMCKVNARAKEQRIQRIAQALELCVLSSKPKSSPVAGPLGVESTEKGKFGKLGFRTKFSSDLVADALVGVENVTGPECYCRPLWGDVCQVCFTEKILRV